MTQRDMAGYLGVTPMTLRNWRKEKPNLYKTILKGFELDKAVDEAKKHYENLKKVAEEGK